MEINLKDLLLKLFKKETGRYVIIGVCTTLLNFIIFSALYYFTEFGLNLSNLIAIVCSIIFAFFTNKIIVFSSPFDSIKKTWKEFWWFSAGRAITMLLEVFGVWLLADALNFNEYLSKLSVQFIVLVLNYFISKFFVFKKKKVDKS